MNFCIWLASRFGFTQTVKELVYGGANIDTQSDDGSTALMWGMIA